VRAVVLLQADHVVDAELALEVAHVADLGAAEGVDALVVVADAEQVGAAAGQQLQPAVLQLIGVLELIDQDVPEALLVVPADRLVALQQLVGAQQQLGEIDHAFALALRLVGFVQLDALSSPSRPRLRPRPGAGPAPSAPLMKWQSSRGGNFSSSTLSAFSRRLTAASWSAESRIWNSCGRPASRWWARSRRLHRPWKVPIHMPRVLIGSMAARRVSISLAALLVKVTARMPCGPTWPV
jgi:hypothetical protein